MKTGFSSRTVNQTHHYETAMELVWAALDYRQRDKPVCWPGLDTIGRDGGLCRDTAAEAVKKLEALGLLTVYRRVGRSNTYTTHLPGIPTGPASVGPAAPPVGKSDSNNHRGCEGAGDAWEERSGPAEEKKSEVCT